MKYDEIMILVSRFYDCKHKLDAIGRCMIVDVIKCKGFDFKTYLSVSKLFDKDVTKCKGFDFKTYLSDLKLFDGYVTNMYYFDLYKAIGAFYEANMLEIWLELYRKGLIMQ